MRYSSEARGYSLALALVPLSLVALFRDYAAGKLAPIKYQGVMMGSWMLVTGLASLFAGRRVDLRAGASGRYE